MASCAMLMEDGVHHYDEVRCTLDQAHRPLTRRTAWQITGASRPVSAMCTSSKRTSSPNGSLSSTSRRRITGTGLGNSLLEEGRKRQKTSCIQYQGLPDRTRLTPRIVAAARRADPAADGVLAVTACSMHLNTRPTWLVFPAHPNQRASSRQHGRCFLEIQR